MGDNQQVDLIFGRVHPMLSAIYELAKNRSLSPLSSSLYDKVF
jgi:hypothetical protein